MTNTTGTEYREFLNEYYQDLYATGADNNRNHHCTAALIAHLDRVRKDHPALRCLDIGFGRGALLKYFHGRGWTAAGVEIAVSPFHVEVTALDRVEVSYCGFLDYQEEGPFDLIVDNGTFHHQHPRDRAAYLTKIAKLMKAEADFLLTAYKLPDRTGSATEVLKDGRFRLSLDDVSLSALLGQECRSLRVVNSMPIVREGRYQDCVLFIIQKQPYSPGPCDLACDF